MKPLVSVITPTHNRSALLREAIESVRAQTFPNWELIVVDDGSTDATAQLLREYSARDARIRYRSQSNRGLSEARRSGIRSAQGTYLAWLDDDDLFLADKLGRQVERMERRRELGFLYAPVWLSGSNGHPLQRHPERLANTFAELFAYCYPMTPSVLIRRSCLEAIGGVRVGLRYCQDYDLWLRLAKRFPFDFLEEPVAIYRKHGRNMSVRLNDLHAEALGLLHSLRGWRRAGLSSLERRRSLARLAYKLARGQMEAKEYGKAGVNFLRSLLWRPDVGFFIEEYRSQSVAHPLRKLIRPYLGALYCSLRALQGEAETHVHT